MMVLAPGRLSTITGWPQSSVSFCPISRATGSVLPPAGKGTRMRIGLLGYAGWAVTRPEAARHRLARKRRRRQWNGVMELWVWILLALTLESIPRHGSCQDQGAWKVSRAASP